MKSRSVLLGCALLLAVLTVNVASSRFAWRLDLTDNQRFSLADSTQQLLANLEEPVTVRMYFSSNLPPQYLSLKRGVDDLLSEYRRYGGRQFQVEYRDPHADEQTAREAMVFGIQPQTMNVVERDRQEVAQVYLGMVMLRGDQSETIRIDPREPTRHLEMGVTGSLVRLTRASTPQVGWWDMSESLPEGNGFHLARGLIDVDHDIRSIDLRADNFDSAQYDSLVVIANTPDQLDDLARERLHQYLVDGGKVVLFSQQVAIQPNFLANTQETGVTPWLQQYGVTIPQRIVADASNAYAVFESGYVSYTVPYPMWTVPTRVGAGVNPNDATVSQLESLIFPWASPVVVEATKGLEVTTLVQSSAHSEVTPGEAPFSIAPEDVALLLESPSQRQHSLAVRLRGNFSEDATQVGELVVIGNAYLLQDRFVQDAKFREGVSFVANHLDAMASNDTLLGIRSRPIRNRRFVHELSRADMLQVRYANMAGVPLLILCGGAVGTLLRRRRYKRLRALYN